MDCLGNIVSPTVSRKRSAVLVRKSIHANLIPHYSSDNLTTVMLESEEQRLLVASCYMAHDRPAPPDELNSLVEFDSNHHWCKCQSTPQRVGKLRHQRQR